MTKATFDKTDKVIETLRERVAHLSQFEMYEKRLDDAGIEPEEIDSIKKFQQIPAMDAEDLANDFTENPPYGSLVPHEKQIGRVNFTPNPYIEDMLPVITTQDDLQSEDGGLYRSLGVTEDDTVLSTGGMTPFPFGWDVASSCEAIGATYLPMGPGNSEQSAHLIDKFDVTVAVGFPSFLLQVADKAESEDALESVELIIATGEPFTAIDGYREQVRQAYGGDLTVVDGYGLAETGSVAHENTDENGMYLFDNKIFPEVIDPETGELVERGEKGELVITHLAKEAVPVLRFRTYDLTILEKRDGDYVLPEGVFGRTDDMQKIKGVKVYPGEIQLHLAGVDGVNAQNVQFRIDRPSRATHRLGVKADADPSTITEEELATEIQSVASVSVDSVTLEKGFEVEDENRIIDETGV